MNAITSQAIEQVFACLDRELWIITARDQQSRGGLVATWVSQASIDPSAPLLSAGIAPNHHTAQLIDAAGAFAAHLLRDDQVELALRFAIGSGRDRDKLAELEWFSSKTGSPILQDCLAWLDCRVAARLEGGDRIYYWADVLDGQRRGSGEPLRERRFFAQATATAREELLRNRDHDISLQRPLREAWRLGLPAWLCPATSE